MIKTGLWSRKKHCNKHRELDMPTIAIANRMEDIVVSQES